MLTISDLVVVLATFFVAVAVLVIVFGMILGVIPAPSIRRGIREEDDERPDSQ